MSKTITPTAPAKVAAPRIDNEIVETLIQMLRLKNHRICQHSFQVANYAVSIAAQMRLPKEEIERIALQSEPVVKQAEGAAPKRVIVVPGRLVNVVL